MLNDLHYIHQLAQLLSQVCFYAGSLGSCWDDRFIMWLRKALSLASLCIIIIIFFFSVAYLILLLFSCINTLICTDLLIPNIRSQVAGAHHTWFPYS